ncbi:hypothetical protein CQ010_01215 [Arthrobacter sp. MYb211]|uniref:hypothetical protein n=1 Tax=unclassified Arthrobacter TaxID=235627 RepID=UPI000CFC1047|nr:MULTISPECIES: hypothetical protein [unclassified Arthrobacter]PRA13293.1 hypothetical protein CQ015_03470 [Arthrobacter sp. MYb221]PRC10490.1 hypothetical protein CQ010_01215 [Arthrobacter sp. MYb211]
MVIKIGAKPTPPKARPGLIFREDNHTYRMNTATNGPEYVNVNGVTTIIGKTLAKPQLDDYKLKSVARVFREDVAEVLSLHEDYLQRMGTAYSDEARRAIGNIFDTRIVELSNRERDMAGIRGTKIHAAADQVGAGKSVKVAKPIAEPVNRYREWLDENDVEVILSERPCGNRTLWYAGTFDLIVKFHAGEHAGETWLVDIKTSKGVYGETSLQAGAYSAAEFYVDEDLVDRPMLPVDKIGVLHLTNGPAKLYWLGDLSAAVHEFEAILTLHKSRKRRDDLIRRAS